MWCFQASYCWMEALNRTKSERVVLRSQKWRQCWFVSTIHDLRRCYMQRICYIWPNGSFCVLSWSYKASVVAHLACEVAKSWERKFVDNVLSHRSKDQDFFTKNDILTINHSTPDCGHLFFNLHLPMVGKRYGHPKGDHQFHKRIVTSRFQ